MSETSREIHLAARPHGEPVDSDFRLAEVEVPHPGPGELLVRNRWMSVDPYMRGRMNDVKSYVPPFALDAPMDGGAVGEVVAGEADGIAVGDTVLHFAGWREWAIVPVAAARKVDTELAPAQAYLGVLGMPGLTAYAGLIEVAALQEGDIVFVSGAAGAVGSLAGQIAKQRGHTVIGSAGSPEKVAHLRDDLGFDAVFNYRDGSVAELLAGAAPDGIDVYFDNVGGEHLEAAIGVARLNARMALCGAIAQYNATDVTPGPRNMVQIVGKRLTLKGFIVSDHSHLTKAFAEEVGGYLASGAITTRETVVDGIERAPEAFIGLLAGRNTGKMLVKL